MNGEHSANSRISPWHPRAVIPSVAAAWVVARFLPQAFAPGSAWRLAIGSLIAPALLYLFAAQKCWFRNLDELQERVLLETFVVTLASILFSVWVLHFVQHAGFLLGVEYFDVVGIAFIIGFFGGYFFSARHYGVQETPPL